MLFGSEVAGLDISAYGIADAKEEVRPALTEGNCTRLPWPDRHFDLVISINTFHNLQIHELDQALREMQRVGKAAVGPGVAQQQHGVRDRLGREDVGQIAGGGVELHHAGPGRGVVGSDGARASQPGEEMTADEAGAAEDQDAFSGHGLIQNR